MTVAQVTFYCRHVAFPITEVHASQCYESIRLHRAQGQISQRGDDCEYCPPDTAYTLSSAEVCDRCACIRIHMANHREQLTVVETWYVLLQTDTPAILYEPPSPLEQSAGWSEHPRLLRLYQLLRLQVLHLLSIHRCPRPSCRHLPWKRDQKPSLFRDCLDIYVMSVQ